MLKSASRQKQNNFWLIPKLHLPEKMKTIAGYTFLSV